MPRRYLVNMLGTFVTLAVGVGTFFLTKKLLGKPTELSDWIFRGVVPVAIPFALLVVPRRVLAGAFAGIVGLNAGLVAFYVSVGILSRPETQLDWVVQGCAGLTVTIITFFLVWGHFQKVGAEE